MPGGDFSYKFSESNSLSGIMFSMGIEKKISFGGSKDLLCITHEALVSWSGLVQEQI